MDLTTGELSGLFDRKYSDLSEYNFHYIFPYLNCIGFDLCRCRKFYQRLVSLFWLGLKTENEEGLKSGKDISPGGVDNYGKAGNLKTYFTTKQFRYQSDVSCIVCCFVLRCRFFRPVVFAVH